jgi:hypothetical protein
MRRITAGVEAVLSALALLLLSPALPRAAEAPDCPPELGWDGSPGYGAATPMPLAEALPLVQREAEGLRFSPGGRWLLSVSWSEAFNLNGIEVFFIREDGNLLKAWEHQPQGAPETYSFFTFLRWDGPETALLCAAPVGDQQVPTPVLLRHGAFGWALQAPR